MTSSHNGSLARIGEMAQERLAAKHAAREQALQISRAVIRLSANSIRAVHRREFDQARNLVSEAESRLAEAETGRSDWPDIYHAGFLSDARKEYAEANITLALISGGDIPQPEDLGIDIAPYLNGLAEAMGELRRFILDALRRNDTGRCDELMETMDDIYSLLVTMDFPEGITGGLRHTTDAMRGVLERTRGDLTMALRQRQLEQKLASLDTGALLAPQE